MSFYIKISLFLLLIPNLIFASYDDAKKLRMAGEIPAAIEILLKERPDYDVFNELGVCYSIVSNQKKALFYFTKALEISSLEQRPKSLNNLGIFYLNEGKAGYAAEFLEKALKINIERKDTLQILNNLTNLSNCFDELGKLNKAIELQKRALPLLVDDSIEIAGVLINLGYYYLELKNDSATYYLSKALAYTDSPFQTKSIYHNLARAFEVSDPNLSFTYYKQFISIRDSLNNQEIQEEIKQIEEKYLLEISELKKKQKEIWAWIAGSLGGGLTIFLLFAAFAKILEFRKRLPKLSLEEKLRNRFPDGSKIYFDAYKKNLPNHIEEKLIRFLTDLIRSSKSDKIFCNFYFENSSCDISIKIEESQVDEDELLQIKQLAKDSGITFSYNLKNRSFNGFITWQKQV